MAFNTEDKPAQFSDLKGILAQSKRTDPALHQTVQILLDRLETLKSSHDTAITNVSNTIGSIVNNTIITPNILATYLTSADEVSRLPQSVQLLPGTGITFDDSIANKKIINSIGGSTDLDYLGNYASATYNDGDIVIGADGIAYMCVKDGTTTPPEAWPGGSGGITIPSPHHTTHEPGGSDQIPNVAWTNLSNTFTQNQLITKIRPDLQLLTTGNLSKTHLLTDANSAYLSTNLSFDGSNWNRDDVSLGGVIIRLSQDGYFWVLKAIPGANPASLTSIFQIDPTGTITSGKIPDSGLSSNIPLKNQSNTFTDNQIIQSSSSALLLFDTSQPVNKKLFKIINYSQVLYLQALSDAQDTVIGSTTIDRSGSVVSTGDITEKNRTTPMGHWINFTPTLTASIGTVTVTINNGCQYTLIGKTLIISFNLTVTLSAAPTQLYFIFPSSMSSIPTYYTSQVFWGAHVPCFVSTNPGTGYLSMYYKDDTSGIPWPTGSIVLQGMITLPIS